MQHENFEMKKLEPSGESTEFLLYTAPNGETKVEVFLSEETLWLTQPRIAELFGVQRPAITKHLKNIFDSGELEEKVVCSILELATPHGAMEGKTQTQIPSKTIRISEPRNTPNTRNLEIKK